jgi:hypothetical protein
MSISNERRKQLLLRLTLRDVLWLIVVAVLGVAWWLERREIQTLTARALDGKMQYIYAIGDAAAEWSAETNREVEISLPDITIVAKPDGRVLRKYRTKDVDDD